MKLWCPKCEMNIETVGIETEPRTWECPAEYTEGCPECGTLEDYLEDAREGEDE